MSSPVLMVLLFVLPWRPHGRTLSANLLGVSLFVGPPAAVRGWPNKLGCSIVGHAVDQGTTNNRSLAARVLMVACTRRPRCLVLPPTFSACPFPADSCDVIEVPPGNPGAIVEARQDVGLRCGCRGLAVAPAQLSSWRPPAPTAPCEIIPLPKPRPKRWRAEPDAAAPPPPLNDEPTDTHLGRHSLFAQDGAFSARRVAERCVRLVLRPPLPPTEHRHCLPHVPLLGIVSVGCFFFADWRCTAQPGCRPILIASYFLASLSWALAFSILALAT